MNKKELLGALLELGIEADPELTNTELEVKLKEAQEAKNQNPPEEPSQSKDKPLEPEAKPSEVEAKFVNCVMVENVKHNGVLMEKGNRVTLSADVYADFLKRKLVSAA